jgi:hypothetical protein
VGSRPSIACQEKILLWCMYGLEHSLYTHVIF